MAPGPLTPLRADELVWLGGWPNFQGMVAWDLRALGGVDGALTSAADRIAHAGDGWFDDGIAGDLAEAIWQLGDIGGILDPQMLDEAGAGADQFRGELDHQRRDLPPESDAPFTYDPGRPGDDFETD